MDPTARIESLTTLYAMLALTRRTDQDEHLIAYIRNILDAAKRAEHARTATAIREPSSLHEILPG